MKILVLGHTGMLGNVAHRYFQEKGYDVIIINKHRWDSIEFRKSVSEFDGELIINCIGAIHQRKYDDTYYKFMNVELPKFLDTIGRKVLNPSTDCVFSGKLEYPNKYTKEDIRDADDMYGKSKGITCELIVNQFKNTKSIRTSIIGHEIKTQVSLIDWFLNTEDDEIINGYVNYFWNGITTLQWCKVAEKILLDWDNSPTLTQVGSEGMNKYDLLKIIANVYNKPNIFNKFQMSKNLNKTLVSDYGLPTIKKQLVELKKYYKK